MTTIGTTYTWTTIRDETIDRFNGDTPGGKLEADIITHFTEDPEHVLRVIDRIAEQHARKPLRSPWAVLRADLNRGAQAEVIADATHNRTKSIDRAKTWIHNAGCYTETWKQVGISLLGDDDETPSLEFLEQLNHETHDYPGRYLYANLLTASITKTRTQGLQSIPGNRHAPFYTLRNDQHARDQLEAEYNTWRPRGILAEHEAETWNAQCAATYQRITSKPATQESEPDEEGADDDIPF